MNLKIGWPIIEALVRIYNMDARDSAFHQWGEPHFPFFARDHNPHVERQDERSKNHNFLRNYVFIKFYKHPVWSSTSSTLIIGG